MSSRKHRDKFDRVADLLGSFGKEEAERLKTGRGDAAKRTREEIAGRIKEAVRGHNVAALARAMGVSRTAIYDWCTGKSTPDVERFGLFASLLGLSVLWLITGRGARDAEDELPEGYILLSTTKNEPPGRPPPPFAYVGIGHLAFNLDWLRTLPGSPKSQSLLLTQASGDAMAPTINDRDLLLLNLADGRKQMRDGLYAIMLLGEPINFLTRRVQKRADGSFRILCDNPAYRSDDTDLADRKDVFFSRVIWSGGSR
jgi:phage repressor protein C with HTH and peptisase S24 domain